MHAELIFARLLLPLGLGICIAHAFPSADLNRLFMTASILAFIGLVILKANYASWNLHNLRWPLANLVYLFFFFIGGFVYLQKKEIIHTRHFSTQKFDYLKISIVNEPQVKGQNVRFVAHVIAGYANNKFYPVNGSISINISQPKLKPVKYGDVLIIEAKYTEIDPPYNPGEFDYKSWMENQNIHHQAFIYSGKYYSTNKNIGNHLLGWGYALRARLVNKFRQMIHDQEAYAVASTLILGYRADLDIETRAAYSATGTVHALSVSGAHVAIVYLFIDYLLFFCNNKKSLKIAKLLIILTALWGYALLTGFSPAVLRAAIMLSTFLLARNFFQYTNSYNILSFSAFCLLIYRPAFLFDVGFQLSYIAVFGLLYIQPILYHSIYVKNKIVDKVWNVIALSIAAQLITFPLSIYYFHQFPVYFLAGNLFIVLPVNAIMGLGLLSLIPGMSFLGSALEFVIHWTNVGLHSLASAPFSTITAIYISPTELILLIVFILSFIIAIDLRMKKLLFLSLISCLLFQTFMSYDKITAWNRRQIIFYSLPKNYATSFMWKDSAIIVTDLPAADKIFKMHITPALEKNNIAHYKTLTLGEDTITNSFHMDQHQIKFFDTNILIVITQLNKRTIIGNPNFTAAWVHGIKRQEFIRLRNSFNAKFVMVDATTKDYSWKENNLIGDKKASGMYFLNKNPAYLLPVK